jgi:hypothetical protein
MRALSPEELVALVQPPERIILAVEHGERQLVVSWHGGGAWWNDEDVWNDSGEGECGKGMEGAEWMIVEEASGAEHKPP